MDIKMQVIESKNKIKKEVSNVSGLSLEGIIIRPNFRPLI